MSTLFRLLTPELLTALATGFVLGLIAAAALIRAGFAAHERRMRALTTRTRLHIRAAESARAWERAGAANDDNVHTPRSDMRRGAR